MSDLDDATNEAIVYNKVGGLDEHVLEGIALEYKVTPEDILEELGWGHDYYTKDDT